MRGAAALSVALALPACQRSEAADSVGVPELALDYEGENFYEGENAEIARVPDDLPGFLGLVSAASEVPACVRMPSSALPTEGQDESLRCATSGQTIISDFTVPPGTNATNINFRPGVPWPGGTYHYPDDEAFLSDASEGNWHLFGTISGISGFGLYLGGCRLVDGSGFDGVGFTLWGSVAPGQALTIIIGTAANQVSSRWVNDNKASPSAADEPDNLGRCIPGTTRYDGSCREPRVVLPVSEEPMEVVLPWDAFTDGCPNPGLNPAELTSFAWFLSPPVTGPYPVDIHIDNIRFLTTQQR